MAAPATPPLPKYNGRDVDAYLNQLVAALQSQLGQIYSKEYQTAAQVATSTATALPSATTAQLYGGTGSAGAARQVTLGTNLSITGSTLNAGTGITALTGDVTASGSGSVVATVGKIGGASISLAGSFATSGAYSSTLTFTGATNVTFPTAGTLASTYNVGVAINAALPSATTSQLYGGTAAAGGAAAITLGTNLSISGGTLSYTLPAATSSVLGGVKPDGTTITNSSGAISVTYGTAANTAAQGNDSRITGALSATTAASTYAPINNAAHTGSFSLSGSAVVLGGAFTTSGAYALTLTLSAATNVTLPTSGTLDTTTARASAINAALPSATTSQLYGGTAAAGGAAAITLGTNLSISGGTLSYTLPAATSSVLGGVKPDGTTITNSSGAISVTYGTAANTAAQGNDSRITGALSATTAASTYLPINNPTVTGILSYPTALPAVTSINATALTSYSFPVAGGIFNFYTSGGTFPTFTFTFPVSASQGVSIVITGSITVTAATFSASGGTVYGAPSSHSPTAAQRYMSDGVGNWFVC